jgi:hypothetical protein
MRLPALGRHRGGVTDGQMVVLGVRVGEEQLPGTQGLDVSRRCLQAEDVGDACRVACGHLRCAGTYLRSVEVDRSRRPDAGYLPYLPENGIREAARRIRPRGVG